MRDSLKLAILFFAICICVPCAFGVAVPIKAVHTTMGVMYPSGQNNVPLVVTPTYQALSRDNVSMIARGAFNQGCMFTLQLTDDSQVSRLNDLLAYLERVVPASVLVNVNLGEATGCDWVRDRMFEKGWRGPMGTALKENSAYSYAEIMGDEVNVKDQAGNVNTVSTFWVTKLVPPTNTGEHWTAVNLTQCYLSFDQTGALTRPILSGTPDPDVVQSTLRDA